QSSETKSSTRSSRLVVPRLMNRAAIKACFQTDQIKKDLKECACALAGISSSASSSAVCPILFMVEERVSADWNEALKITRPEASEAIEEIRAMVEGLRKLLQEWRSQFPDTSPMRVNNGLYQLRKSHAIPTLIAYSLALAQHLFAGLSEANTNITLQVLRLYGAAMAALGGEVNILQTRAIDDIPSRIETVEDRFELNIETVIYVVCTRCNYPYAPESSAKSKYPSLTCTNRSPPESPPCNTTLLDSKGKPLKAYEYYPFSLWFAQFIAQPGIQQYAKGFCDEVLKNPIAPMDKMHTWDGDIYRMIRGPDGELFVNGGEEGRFFFLLHLDFFNSEGTTGRGKYRSTGIASLRCLNLPYHLRENINNIYISGFWQGPDEPSGKDGQLAPLLEPFMKDMEQAYTRGIVCHGSPQEYTPSFPGDECTFRCVVAGSCMDLKAARPSLGLRDVTSHHICGNTCTVFHKTCTLRTDHENWTRADDTFLREGMQRWREAQSEKEREIVADYYGTRQSAFEILPYFNFSTQSIPDPMHAFYHRIVHLFIRNALKLTTLSRTVPLPQESDIAFYHNFLPPPRPNPSQIASKSRTTLLNLVNTFTYDSSVRVGHIHRYLCQPLYDRDKLEKSLETATMDALMYVCLDLNRVPRTPLSGKMTKELLIRQLVHWRLQKPTEPLLWPAVNSGEVLSQVHQCFREVLVPSYFKKPPFDACLKSGGTLKAHDWRVIITLYLPLAMLSLWSDKSPIRADNSVDMQSVLETSMNLTCASILMAKRSVTSEQRQAFLQHYKAHVEGLKQDFPGFSVPTHHVAFHVYDFIGLFSGVRNFWCFGGERLVGKAEHTPTNHRPGQFENTLLHKYSKGVMIQCWLMRRDCPPLLKICNDLLNETYHSSTTEDGQPGIRVGSRVKNLPRELSRLLKARYVHKVALFTRIESQNQMFAVMGAAGPGNSFICFRLPGDSEWRAGQIKYIFQQEGGPFKFAVRENIDATQRQSAKDPFRGWWSGGFEAKLVSRAFAPDLRIVDWECVIAHTARWDVIEGLTLVVNLSVVNSSLI
ncbi:hypothetical protein F5880DRAFT_1492798, partial [Lentinula raphanica]